MEITSKPPALLATLQNFDVFEGIRSESLQWLIDHSEYICYEPGDYLFRPGEPVNEMQVIVEGQYVIERVQSGETQELGVWGEGYVTGVLPFSRMKEAVACGRALERCCVLELDKACFTEMINNHYELTQALVSVMATRVRDFTSMRFQSEKLMALGKLSAGLAHELNNPASAMVRDAQTLYDKIHKTPEKFKAVMTMRVTPEQTDQVNAILFERLQNLHQLDLSSMERMDRMDELLDWLEDHGIDDGDDIAETFVDFGMTTDDLDRVEAILDGKHLPSIMGWLESTMSLEKLVADIQESSGRIQQLVQSIKQYSHMDRGVSMEPVDIHEGLRSTLTILDHSLKNKAIEVRKQFDKSLPSVPAYAGELNQLWTNLISNAVDAMAPGGVLSLRSYPERHYACVEVTDNGSGISEEHLSRIFDPFFTTKAMGDGTGLGLEIVKRIVDRHRAIIKVDSNPGKTTFKVCFRTEQP